MSSHASGDPPVEVGLYIHVPFCVRRCFYCDFNTYTLDRQAVVRFLDAIAREADRYAAAYGRGGAEPVTFDTVYIGGGTPTCLSAKDLTRLLELVRERFAIREGAEITCEANPGSSNVEKFAGLVEAGVNRLSLGVQSLDDALLLRLGRVHTAGEAVESFHAARSAGFDNINLDLMFGLPGQDGEAWRQTFSRILALGPEHISAYSLIIEDGTAFGDAYARGELALPGEEAELAMYEWAIEAASEAGYEHYEISNFARPGFRSRHNQIYWRVEPYLALGPGAHGFMGGERYANLRLPEAYAQALDEGRLPVDVRAPVDRDEEMDDVMIFGLRLLEGVSRDRFRGRFGVPVEAVYAREIERLEGLGLIEAGPEAVRLTRRGLPLANRVFQEFLRVPASGEAPSAR